jgi:hypothetical protein
MLINLIAFAIVIAVVRQSPLVSLISDGIFSIGLLPLAIFFASWSIGVMCLVQSSSFAMQAWYLVTDRPADMQFITMTSVFCWGVSVALLVSTVTTLGLRRRAEAKDRTRALSRLPQGSQPQS